VFEEVRLLPSLKCNLISLSELKKKEYMFKSEWRILMVMKGSMVVMKGMRKNDFYALQGVVLFVSVPPTKKTILPNTEI